MAWDFETDPEFQKKLDWIEDFMREEVEPLSHLGMAVHGMGTPGTPVARLPLDEAVARVAARVALPKPELFRGTMMRHDARLAT